MTSSGGAAVTTTYTSWDSSGRPTASTQTGAVNRTYQISYDDNALSQTFTPISGGGPTNIWRYDTAGIRTSVTIIEGSFTSVSTFSVAATGQVCR